MSNKHNDQAAIEAARAVRLHLTPLEQARRNLQAKARSYTAAFDEAASVMGSTEAMAALQSAEGDHEHAAEMYVNAKRAADLGHNRYADHDDDPLRCEVAHFVGDNLAGHVVRCARPRGHIGEHVGANGQRVR